MLDLNRASTFVRVVETGGFSRAAEALALPTSSVSRSVAHLESDLGVRLLERTTRKIALTDAGRAFYERAREALAGLEHATELALDVAHEVHGVVRIAVPPDFAPRITAVLAPFLDLHPRIRVEITFTAQGMDLVGDLVDVAVALGKLPDSSLTSRRVGVVTHRIVAAPRYLEARGVPRTIGDLASHDAILLRGAGGEQRWELTGPDGVERVKVRGRLIGDHLRFVADAALAGLGLALLPTFLGDAGIAEGTLVAVLPHLGHDTPIHVLTHGSRHVPRRVALLRDHLVGTVGARCREHGGC